MIAQPGRARNEIRALSGWLRLQPDLTARPAIQEKPPTTAKNTTAVQASESESLSVTIAAKIVSAAIPDMKAIAKQHQ
jgi:hypothetical protein